MNYKKAIKELRSYLKPQDVIEIELAMAIPGVGICLTISRIVQEFNSSQSVENLVCEYLQIILRYHFNKKVTKF